ncbi:MAG TPA: glycosyltransferase [Terracidiphilus sp.]|nr:glycosyltransferase [Terracidiphilus sp.]
MPRNLRVLLAIPHLGGGGAEKVIALLAQGLSKAKYEVHLVSITQRREDLGSLPPGVVVRALGKRRVRDGALPLLRLVLRLKPDVVLSSMFHLNFLILLLRPLFPRKVRVLIRQNGTVSSALASSGLPWYVSLLYRFLYPRADRVICQSSAMADDLAAKLYLDRNKIAVLPNPVEFEGIHSAVSRTAEISHWSGPNPNPEPNLRPNFGPNLRPHLLAVGRLAAEKGFDLLLEAFAIVRQRYPDAELLIAGAGPEESPLKTQSRSLRLEHSVRFIGYVERPYDLYADASLFVLSSRHEGMPNALLEAAVAGLPIVATPASGGVIDLLRSLDGVWLAQAATANALASALLQALGTLKSKQRFSRSFSGEFDFTSAIERYEALIDSVCAPPEANHVALVIPTLDRIGGAERHVMLLAHGLLSRGWRVSVVALSGCGGAAARELMAAGVSFLSLGMRKGLADPRGWLRFHRWLRREKPDVVHAHLPHATWFCRWSRLCASIPVLIDTLHSASTGTVARRIGYRLSRWLPDQVTAVSRSVAESHEAAGMVNRNTLTVLHNGVDVDKWHPDPSVCVAARANLALTNEFLWMAAGRLEPVKDHETLLKAMALLQPPAQLVIAGDGPLLHDLTALASHLGLSRRVHFLGFVQDVKRWLQAADAFVLSSRWEGLPMAVLEAGACGLPAVMTDVPGSREAILDGETGMLAPPANPSGLASAMNAMMRLSFEERRAMGMRARQRVADQFSLTATLDRCDELYRSLFARTGCINDLVKGHDFSRAEEGQ